MHLLPLFFFIFTYLGMALGRMPGLALDRTGFAILGAVAFLATGEMTLAQAKEAVDAPTMVLLFGMMTLSVLYQLSGLYGAIAAKLARVGNPKQLMLGTILVSGGLSAILTNDVVCFALTPLLVAALRQAKLKPLPYLLALACAANLGSALTPIGNPQNILISQRMRLPFLPFVLACAAPVAVSMGFLYWWVSRTNTDDHGGWTRSNENQDNEQIENSNSVPPVDPLQAKKAVVLTLAAMILFLTPIPAYLTALVVAGVVLLSRRTHTRSTLALVDWHLLALFAGLFVVVRGLEVSGWTDSARDALARAGADLSNPLIHLPLIVILSNLVGNVPAVMIMLPFLKMDGATGHGLALASTFAGNALLPGSIAN
ncbi:MAG: anion transporter, partial [Verrucomicrobia bacterium]|nr:anion transporter [Verrucomicrobiota bacterium]